MAKNKNTEVKEQTPDTPPAPATVSLSVGFRKMAGARWSTEVFEHQWDEAGALIKTTLKKAFPPSSWSFAFENYRKVALDEVDRVSK